MLRLYLTLIRDIPSVLRGTHEAWAYWLLTVAVPVVVWRWPNARPFTESPWLVLTPVGISVLYGMMRVNYLRFQKLEASLYDAKSALTNDQDREEVRNELGALLGTFSQLKVRAATNKDIGAVQQELKAATKRLRECIEKNFDKGEVALLTPSTFVPMDSLAQALAKKADKRQFAAYAQASHYAAATERLLRSVIPPTGALLNR